MNLGELFIGQIPEAIYFALFMIYTKQLKSKRFLLIGLIIVEYLLCINALPYSLWCHIWFFVLTYIILKLLYKDKSQITDVFILGIASIWLIVSSILPSFLININYILYAIITRLLMFSIFIFYKKLPKIQLLYKKLWNRNDKISKYMKSTTFRSLNVVVFNLMFWLINLGIVYYLCNN